MFAVHLLISVLVALAVVHAKVRPGVFWCLVAAAIAALISLAIGGGETRSLELTHAFTALIESTMKSKDFVTGQVEAPAWQWPLIALVYCLAWAFGLRAMQDRAFHPFLGPMAVAWSGIGAIILFEMTAAPAGLVRPFAFERVLFPAGVAAAIMFAHRCDKLLMTFCWLTVFVSAARLPIAVIGTIATGDRWENTSLDVHTITNFANPLMQRPLEPAAGSYEQLAWLVWGPEILVLPALYMLSLSGIAFMATMLHRHPKPRVKRQV